MALYPETTEVAQGMLALWGWAFAFAWKLSGEGWDEKDSLKWVNLGHSPGEQRKHYALGRDSSQMWFLRAPEVEYSFFFYIRSKLVLYFNTKKTEINNPKEICMDSPSKNNNILACFKNCLYSTTLIKEYKFPKV